MGTLRSAVLAGIGLCLLASAGCVYVPGPPVHAPAPGYRAKHYYRYYPQEQVYFDSGRRVYFYLEGRNWRTSGSLPGWLHIDHARFITIEMEHDRPYLEFERHRTSYPRHRDSAGHHPGEEARRPGPPPHAPAHGYRAKHQYRYYPREQVYFDPGRRVYFYLEGGNWSMGASLPTNLLVTQSRFVTVEMEHDRPYLEFEKHKDRYPGLRAPAGRERRQREEAHRPGRQERPPISKASHQYRYYPQEQVYFDPGQQVFFYLDGSNWRRSASLPGHLQVRHSDFVTLEMDHDKPYLEFKEHKSKYVKHQEKEREKDKKKEKKEKKQGQGWLRHH